MKIKTRFNIGDIVKCTTTRRYANNKFKITGVHTFSACGCNPYGQPDSLKPGVCSIHYDLADLDESSYSTHSAEEKELVLALPDLLDDVEKEYLKSVIKPFRHDVVSIMKLKCGFEEGHEYISINLTKDTIQLPTFKANKMYTGLKSGHFYTLKELDL